ncbi:MAG: hypothetical protein QM703_11190 [Gemmatales bacterium]
MDNEFKKKFSVYAECEGHSSPLYLTHLTFPQLIDDIVVPYESNNTFFIDGVALKKERLKRIKIIQHDRAFNILFENLHQGMRMGELRRQSLYASQYQVRLDAILRESGTDVTSQVIKAYDATIKPNIASYLPQRAELIRLAYNLFMEGIKALIGS